MTTEHCKELKIFYGEILHWRLKFFTLQKNKTGDAIIDTLHTTMSALLDRSRDAFLVVIVMPQLVLPRTKGENDEITEPTEYAKARKVEQKSESGNQFS